MSNFYNAFIGRNRDYRAIATELLEILGNRQKILDIGIGTGLLAEQLIQLKPLLQITGIDTSTSLLAQAQTCLGSQVELYCQDVCNLELDQTFDAAYSRGGAWAFIRDSDTFLLASHIQDIDAIQQSFERVAAHLYDGGYLIITTSNANHSKLDKFDGEMSFERTVSKNWVDGEQYLIIDYVCHKHESITEHQRVQMRLLELDYVEGMLSSAGFQLISYQNDQYRIYQKGGDK
ncbi:class I SAM-dependent methyltransferase [Okeania sp.]|uniref:class I SAM-dependent methyltransferase n=1 Tax=Okeania sp. TaxID=3100323 RepID=UPI002B4ABD2A|nr:class I SAM-dependent methyltransferase [Okeania sp.]MEB3342597.1 class I SAM-dependent methyltransferase [Okeania sp.]